LRESVAEPGSHPFNNQRFFKLAHGSDNLEHQPTGWCAEIDVVPRGDKCDPIGKKSPSILRRIAYPGRVVEHQCFEI
jgi:hypothetical protein